MRCKKCGKQLKDLDFFCDKCYTAVDIVEHEKKVDELLQNGTIKKQNVQIKNNHILCDKCGANVKIGEGYCKNCRHILCEEVFINDLKEGILVVKKAMEEKEIRKNTRGLRFACLCVPLLGLILAVVYIKSNPILSELCFDAWITGLGKIRAIIILLVLVLIWNIF